MNVATATPVEIDTRLAEIHAEMARHQKTIETQERFLDRAAEVEGTYRQFSEDKIDAARCAVAAAQESRTALISEAMPLQDEYDRRPWTRFYLVTNTGGHVHSSMTCNQCFVTTQYAWLVDYSGTSHADLVEEAGSTACTVCFPDAPVDVLRRKTRIEAPERKARRLEREAKAAAKAAAEVRVMGFQGDGGSGVKVFKTVRAVTNDIASNLSSLTWYGVGHPTAREWLNDIKVCREALSARGEAYDYDKALAAARKKVTREGGSVKF